MTVIRPNSISGITSITAQANEINIFRSDGTLAGLQINGINFNNTSGISTLAALNVTGNVSIAGTLTYEDVTNVDSVGIITARSTIDAQGDVSIADKIIHTGDTNTAIRFPAADTISFECAGEEILKIGKSSTELLRISGPIDASTQQEFGIGIAVNDAHTHPAAKITFKEFDASDSRGDLLFYTRGTNNDVASTERLRITSDGKVGINSSAPNTRLDVISSSPVSRTWTPGSSVLSMFERNGHCRIALISSATSYSEIDFADANDDNSGYIRYDNSDNSMSFRTNGSGEALRITSGGLLQLNNDAARIQLGASQDLSIYHDGSSNRIIAANADLLLQSQNYAIRSENGSTTYMNISSTGAVTIPAQPCVQLHTVSNIGSLGSSFNNTPFQFSGVHINQGGMTLSNSNSRVQVPVSGIYLVTAMASGGNYSTADAGDGVRFKLRRNGSDYPDTNAYPISTLGSSSTQEYYFTFSILVDLTASDYLEVMFDNISTSFGGSISRGQLGVHLVS